MDDDESRYIQDYRHIAERLVKLLQRRRLLRDRLLAEDYEECRESAHDLRKVFENEMLAVTDRGFLLAAITDMQTACTNFVSAAGRDSANFRRDDELFRYHLIVLREVFAKRLRLIVEKFDLQVTPEIQAVINFAP
ncbi:hypothetical protein [Segeticoccus rhizosphaerae]|uniref:hypothetical protein n=1 Tax=Segeticoccus rhizosphaerae TaxID=1104777 RepID=UPI0010C11685|nr:hypothetical protein [Ornithinicoccus soli]